MHEKFDPTIFVSDLSIKLNNLNPEADDVNTVSDEFFKVFNDTLDTHAPYRYAFRKEQGSFNIPWLTKGILISTAKIARYKKQLFCEKRDSIQVTILLNVTRIESESSKIVTRVQSLTRVTLLLNDWEWMREAIWKLLSQKTYF